MKFFKSALMFGIPFGLLAGFYFGSQYGLLYGVISGIIAGVVFGLGMATFTIKFQNRIKTIKTSVAETVNESEILFSSCVDKVDGLFPELGWLLLTKTHLIFTEKAKKNTQPPRIEIALDTIQEVKTCKHRLNPNAILVTYNGKEQKFLMDGFGEFEKVRNTTWVEKIQNAIKEIRS